MYTFEMSCALGEIARPEPVALAKECRSGGAELWAALLSLPAKLDCRIEDRQPGEARAGLVPNTGGWSRVGATRRGGEMQPDPHVIDEVVRRIAGTIRPVRIILFGSAARGDMREGSDIDLLVVVPDGMPRRRTAQSLQSLMSGIPYPVDIKVATTTDLESHARNPGLVFETILLEGREDYAA